MSPTRCRQQHARAAMAMMLAPLLTRCLPGSGGPIAQWSGPPFSADIVDLRDPTKAPTRIYLGDGKMRLNVAGATGATALVLDPAHGSTLVISDKDRTYIDAGMFTPLVTVAFAPVMHFVRPASGSDPCVEWNTTVDQFTSLMRQHASQPPPHFTCRSEGTEPVAGRPAQKWAVTGSSERESGAVWIDQRLHIVSKSADGSGQMELRNIREGPQPPALFAAPAGYQKLSVAAMVAGLAKQAQTPSTATGSR